MAFFADIFRKKRIIVMGLGLHGGGVAAARWFSRARAHVLVTDIRDAKILRGSVAALAGYRNITYVLGRHRRADFLSADLIIKNPGVSSGSKFLGIARQRGIPIETDVSIFLKLAQVPIIAVTGTKGKSTTASLIHHIFKTAGIHTLLGGNIRVSPLALLEKIRSKTLVVLELSSWQLEDLEQVRFRPHVAVITNVMQDHLNTYRSFSAYAAAKRILIRFQRQGDTCVLNFDNSETRKMSRSAQSRVIWFSTRYNPRSSATIRKGAIICDGNKRRNVMPVSDLKLSGPHNVANVLAAVAVARLYNISLMHIKNALKTFTGIPGRMQLIRTVGGTRYVNDTAATSPDAAIASLKFFRSKIVLIAGGSDKKLDYVTFARAIKAHVHFCILLAGSATDKIIRQLNKIGYHAFVVTRSMEAAVIMASQIQEARTVLLSPGAASFGLFLHEFDRGDRFTHAVRAL